jgi:hypothetical protein
MDCKLTLAVTAAATITLCATAQGQPSPLVAGNNAAAGNGPIATTDFPEGPTVSFIPDGAKVGTSSNGRGILVLGNKLYYTELSDQLFGPTDFIRAAPFNGGKGGPDNAAWTLTNPRPGCGVQDLAYHDGHLYALTGYSGNCFGLQVFKIAVGDTVWSAPVTIDGPDTVQSADGFTILVNNGVLTFLINDGDGFCTYREYDSNTGLPTGNNFTVPPVAGTPNCTGVDTQDSDTGSRVLFFSRISFTVGGSALSRATLTTTPSWSLSAVDTVDPGPAWSAIGVEDISLVHGFDGTPGSANCHGRSVSGLTKTYGGMPNAASALGYATVADLQAGIDAFCGD